MKCGATFAAILLTATLIACGGAATSSPSRTGSPGSFNPVSTNPGTGAWSETLVSSTGQQLGSFTFNMTQSGTSLSATGMNFTNLGVLGSCFGAGAVMIGQMGAGMVNGGTMTMTMSFTPPGSMGTNTITMQGNMAPGMISGSGTFTVTGQTPGCTSQTGTFSMTRTSITFM